MIIASEVYECDHPKARRPHRCCECLGVIAKGEVYNRHHGVFDGVGFTHKVCTDCNALRLELDDGLHFDQMTAFTELEESVFNSNEAEVIQKWLAILTKRGVEIEEWMTERLEEAE